ncbi:MAG: DNA polymerase III subunit chi [Legionellaceae bacterium]
MMPRIDFYLLKENTLGARLHCACRIIDKAYQQNHKIYIQVNTLEIAQQLDDILWIFRDISFIPHQIYNENNPLNSPIQIGIIPPPENFSDILINLTEEIISQYKQFQRVIEIIPNQEELKHKARNHYRIYREAGCELKLHDLNQ